jgi:hypothetical protein
MENRLEVIDGNGFISNYPTLSRICNPARNTGQFAIAAQRGATDWFAEEVDYSQDLDYSAEYWDWKWLKK